MNTKRRLARIAGLWYLLMAATGPIGIVYAPSKVRVAGDAAATAAALLAHDTLARIGVAASVICQIIFVFLVLALQRLFDGVDDELSRLMHGIVIAAVPIAIANELLVLGALELVGGAGGGIAASERDSLALSLLNVHELGVSFVCGVFWGLWLFPFGMLAIRSRYIPKVLGLLLIVGGCTYLVDAALCLAAPAIRASLTGVLMIPLAVGELSMVVWLVVKGVRGTDAIPPQMSS